jgi:hypothetical protein
LRTAEDAALRSRWSVAAERYGTQPFLYNGLPRAAEIIATIAAERRRARAPAAVRAKPSKAEVVYVVESGRAHS